MYNGPFLRNKKLNEHKSIGLDLCIFQVKIRENTVIFLNFS